MQFTTTPPSHGSRGHNWMGSNQSVPCLPPPFQLQSTDTAPSGPNQSVDDGACPSPSFPTNPAALLESLWQLLTGPVACRLSHLFAALVWRRSHLSAVLRVAYCRLLRLPLISIDFISLFHVCDSVSTGCDHLTSSDAFEAHKFPHMI